MKLTPDYTPYNIEAGVGFFNLYYIRYENTFAVLRLISEPLSEDSKGGNPLAYGGFFSVEQRSVKKSPNKLGQLLK
jgi:hypothetical protein